ncbi:MAG: transposase [Flavobacteriaceae bacterium]|nr:transposase [Flavobacteriaceae bacterium]
MDEKADQKGHRLVFVACDATAGILWDIAKGRSQKATIDGFKNVMPKGQRKCIQTDMAIMWQSLIKAQEHVFPQAQ